MITVNKGEVTLDSIRATLWNSDWLNTWGYSRFHPTLSTNCKLIAIYTACEIRSEFVCPHTCQRGLGPKPKTKTRAQMFRRSSAARSTLACNVLPKPEGHQAKTGMDRPFQNSKHLDCGEQDAWWYIESVTRRFVCFQGGNQASTTAFKLASCNLNKPNLNFHSSPAACWPVLHLYFLRHLSPHAPSEVPVSRFSWTLLVPGPWC